MSQEGAAGDQWVSNSLNTPGQDSAAVPSGKSDPQAFKQKARSLDVAVRQMEVQGSLEPGYYIITGVFSVGKNLKREVRKLKRKKLEAGSFVNPENGLNYVYASSFANPEKALQGAITKMDGAFSGDCWILDIEGEDPVQAAEMSVENTSPQTGMSSGQEISRQAGFSGSQGAAGNGSNAYRTEKRRERKRSSLPYFNTGDEDAQGIAGRSTNQLIRKADDYYAKMWYADAAKFYEAALERNPELKSAETIKRLADAHYFNTDMERAHYWYDILYNMQRGDMSAENMFRYAHALKGNGKYGRAKRFMRLYDRMMADGGSRPDRAMMEQREAILDNILSAEEGYEVKNLKINTKYSDFAPMFYEKNEIVFASSVDSAFFHTRRYKWNDQPYLDLYVAKMNEEADELEGAVKFSKKLNSKYHEAAVTFSPDKQTIYFTRNNYGKKLRRDRNGVNHLKLYMSRKVDGRWTEAVELPFNGEDYSTGHPALSPDGKQLYFVSDMPGSIGGTDIFVVDVLGEGQFSEPRNLGPEINTEKKEMFPFINGSKLYFSSNGHVGLGGLDVYEVSFDEEAEGFLEVRNLGKPINSNKDDFSYIVDEETQKGFFASNRRGGKGDDDLYSFQRLLPEEMNENAIEGIVSDVVTGDTLPNALVTLLDENGMKLVEMRADEDGAFVFEELDSNTRYVVSVENENYLSESLDVATLQNERISIELPLKKLDERILVEDGVRKLKTENIYFDFDRYTIRKDASEELDKLVAVMNEYPTMIIAIESHTDSRGPAVYNKYLSQKRADSTRDYLIRKGIDPGRIQRAEGFGEERLLNGCDGSVRCSREQHQLNRRSEFIIVSM